MAGVMMAATIIRASVADCWVFPGFVFFGNFLLNGTYQATSFSPIAFHCASLLSSKI